MSFFAWALPDFGNIAFFVILLLLLVISLQDLRYGVVFALVELITGSHGYLFSLNIEGLSVSLRIGVFIVLLTAGLLNVIKRRRLAVWRSFFFVPLVVLAAMIVWSVIYGLTQGNGYANIFFDVNSFLYFLMVIPIWQSIQNKDDWMLLLKAGTAAVIASVIKVFLLLYVFSHEFWWMMPEIYRWVRDLRIGEITLIQEPFYRIFFQSQLYTIFAFFIILLVVAGYFQKEKIISLPRNKLFWRDFMFAALLFSSVLISFSRSNWAGILVAGAAIPLVYWLSAAKPQTKILSAYFSWFLVSVVSLAVVTIVVVFPYPRPSGDFNAGSLISKRAMTFTGEAGVSSRWQLLPPLWEDIKHNPVLGAGFGEEVTYITEDPRILAQSPTGEYTTTTFEWGYLDLWLKLGLVGLFVYALFVFTIIKESVRLLRFYKKHGTGGIQLVMAQGMLLGGLALLATHTFSPYLNHPLGIGYLIFWGLFVDIHTD